MIGNAEGGSAGVEGLPRLSRCGDVRLAWLLALR